MRKSKVDGVGYTLDGVKLGIADLNMLQSLRPAFYLIWARKFLTNAISDDF